MPINTGTKSAMQRWLLHPQRTKFRKILFQIHMWSGIGFGLYIFFISITGSVLVYRNELYVAAIPEPIITEAQVPVLDDDALIRQAEIHYPGYQVSQIRRFKNQDQAVEVWLENDRQIKKRLFDPRTGIDAGSAVETAVMLVTKLIEIHESFLAGTTGRKLNGVAGIAVTLILLTGFIIWWPGRKRFKRSLAVHRGVGWRRTVWDIHSMVGFWCFAFMLVFALSGIYLCFPASFHQFSEYLEPSSDENAGRRIVDSFLYWLAFLHFGRIDGIGLPCDGPGLCDQSVKAVWAFFGLAPAVMFTSGAIMWWNRVLRRRLGK